MKRRISGKASQLMLGPWLDELAADSRNAQSPSELCRQLRMREEALWEHAETYRALTENSPDAVERFDRKCRHLYMNPAAVRFHGKSVRKIIGKTPAQLGASQEHCELWAKSIQQVFDTGQPVETEGVVPGSLGSRVLNLRWIPEFAADGTIAAVLAVSRDVTEHRAADEELRKTKEELQKRVAERTAELSLAVDALQEEVAMRLGAEEGMRHSTQQLRALAAELSLAEQRERRRMAQVLHDDLQQLLVGTRLRVAVLKRAKGESVRKAAIEADNLLGESLQVTRSLTSELSPPVLHEGDMVAALEWLSKWMGQKHGLNVRIEAQGRSAPETEDVKVLLFQSVRELLFNVVKHAKVKRARVHVDRSPRRIRITVADRGRGFHLGRLRAHGAQDGGFGLFSIRERLELLGGGLEIKSAPGKGSEFTLTVPLQCSLDGRHNSAHAAPPNADGAAPPLQTPQA